MYCIICEKETVVGMYYRWICHHCGQKYELKEVTYPVLNEHQIKLLLKHNLDKCNKIEETN